MAFEGARVLLAGGTSGLGLAVAQAVAERGATPIVVSRTRACVDRALGLVPADAEGDTVDLGTRTRSTGSSSGPGRSTTWSTRRASRCGSPC